MAIQPICDRCKNELDDFGGLLFSPPDGTNVEKYHLCKKCYGEIKSEFS